MHLLKTLIIFAFLTSNAAQSYPNFIGKGYHNCLTCHYNPFGNGPLNDYGRGVAASALAGRLLVIDKKTTDEVLGNRSAFFFNKPSKNKLFRPSLDYRGMKLKKNLETDEPQESWINMQIDASITSEFGKKNKYIASYTYSIVPSNSLPSGKAEFGSPAGEDLTYSREHYIGYRIKPNYAIYLGKMDKVFGLRIADHTTFARAKTKNDQYSATHGAVIHYGQETFDLGAQVFIGDLEKEEAHRSKGLASKFEYSVDEEIRVGLSLLSESFEGLDNIAYSFLTKMRVGAGSSLMFEVGQIQTTPKASDTKTQQYILLKNHFYITRGLYFMTTYEQFIPDMSTSTENHRFSPGIQYFPMQRIEVQANITNSKEYSTSSAIKDTWEFLGQVHLWF